MVSTQHVDLVSSIGTHDCTRVADICNIAHLVNDETRDDARPTLVKEVHVISPEYIFLCKVEEALLSFGKPRSDRLLRVLREVIISNDELVQIVS